MYKNKWEAASLLTFLAGFLIIFLLAMNHQLGLNLFWNLLIPFTPIIIFFFPGLWRNICPLSFIALFPNRHGFSKKIKLSKKQQLSLNYISIVLLFIIIPSRHLFFNHSAYSTAALLIIFGVVAFSSGYFFHIKSGWCHGLCPINPVEKLYGLSPAKSFNNYHCKSCNNCISKCSDITTKPLKGNLEKSKFFTFFLSSFPGLIFSWFHILDVKVLSLESMIFVYAKIGFYSLISFMMFTLLFKFCPKELVTKYSAWLSISLYYYFRVPILLGHTIDQNSGILIDLTSLISHSSLNIFSLFLSSLFFYHLIFKQQKLALKNLVFSK